MSGAVAKLLTQYAEKRGVSRREIAGILGVSRTTVAALLAGQDSRGTKYLGVTPDDEGVAVLALVAQELGVPKAKLATALLDDLGWNERG